MRFCFVSRQFDPFITGGIGTYVSQMSSALTAAGHEVHILTEPHPRLQELGPLLRPGVRFHAVDPASPALGAYPVPGMRYSMAVHEALGVLHARFGFDYIEFPEYLAEGYFALRARRTLGALSGAVLAVRLHTPSVMMREHDRQYDMDRDRAYVDHMEAATIAEADLVLSPSRALLDLAAAIPAPGIPRNAAQRRAVMRLPHAVARASSPCSDLSQVARASSPCPESPGRPAEGSRAGSPCHEVLYFGRIQFLKGPHLIVEAGQRLLESGAPATFRLIGADTPTGPFGRSMLSWCRARLEDRWQDRFEFEGARPRADLPAAIASASVCVFPSLWENFSMATVEAMAAGACVVASDAGGFPELIRDGVDGLLFRAGDAASLEAALRRALADPGLRRSLDQSAIQRVRTLCDPAALVVQLVSLVAECRASTVAPPRPAPSPRSSPAVSVVIPYYNMGRYLPETLASIRRQTFTDYEVLVVNDGSTDPESIALLDRLGPGVRVLHKPNGGLGSARNHGLRHARARFVLPLDSDDLVHETYLEKTVRVMEVHPGLALVSTLGANFTLDPEHPHGGWCPLGLDRDLLAVVNIGAASASLLDREIALSVGGYDEWLTSYEDWDFWSRLAEAGHAGLVIPEFLFQYRVRADSMFRTEALGRHAALRAYLIQKHPRLARDPALVMRMEAGGVGDWSLPFLAERRAAEICQENLRYRLADRVNDALKTIRVHRAIKGLAGRVIGRDERR